MSLQAKDKTIKENVRLLNLTKTKYQKFFNENRQLKEKERNNLNNKNEKIIKKRWYKEESDNESEPETEEEQVEESEPEPEEVAEKPKLIICTKKFKEKRKRNKAATKKKDQIFFEYLSK